MHRELYKTLTISGLAKDGVGWSKIGIDPNFLSVYRIFF